VQGVHEFTFNAMSVGRLALSLHQAIRNHRIALPHDELLIEELIAVRLRKNSLGVYRLDHDSGGHDDQAVTLALGVHWLLEADGSAAMWIEWALRKAQGAETERLAAAAKTRQLTATGGQPGRVQDAGSARAVAPGGGGDAPLEGGVLDPATARRRARDEAWRAQCGHQFGRLAASGR
jgi:hypothetical protein